MMASRRSVGVLLLAVLLGAVLAGGAWARSTVLRGGGDFGVQVYTPSTIARLGTTPVLRGEVLLTPAREDLGGASITYYLDEKPRFATNQIPPEYLLDTSSLDDGPHVLRVEASRNDQLIASTGSIPFHVANTALDAALGQAMAAAVQPTFIKLYYPYIERHIVWFNKREGDLEKRAFMRHGQVYMTLNDLIRHIGGQIEWCQKTARFHTIYWSAGKEKELVDRAWPRGPGREIIVVTRGQKKVQVLPGSATVIVNGSPRSLGAPAQMIGGRTYVPVRAVCGIFDIDYKWSDFEHRAHVSFVP
jgi:hypothetical protein